MMRMIAVPTDVRGGGNSWRPPGAAAAAAYAGRLQAGRGGGRGGHAAAELQVLTDRKLTMRRER